MRSIPTRTAAACTLAAATLLLASCTSSSSQAQPGPGSTTAASGTASAKPSDGGSYSSSSDVISALKSAGHACTPVSSGSGTSLKAPGLQSVAACTISSSGSSTTDSVTATVFDNHTDALAYATLLTSSQASGLLIGGTSERAVVGQNWVVLVPNDTAYAQQVSSALGGTIVSATSSPAA
ncbi:MAG TPA: hypothetical protein VL551_00730 [Actinospica sp.]|jgi:hypothetical protein|nr:hypothetical protein [Actinospica sp.]